MYNKLFLYSKSGKNSLIEYICQNSDNDIKKGEHINSIFTIDLNDIKFQKYDTLWIDNGIIDKKNLRKILEKERFYFV